VDLSEVRAVYRRAADLRRLGGRSASRDRANSEAEDSPAIREIWDTLETRPHCMWMNHPARATVASVKVLQVRLAARAGLRTPRTLVTSDPEAAWDFRAACGGRAISTLLGGPMAPYDFGDSRAASRLALLTMERTRVPVLLQEQIISTRTLRVVVVDQRTFAGTVLPDGPDGAELPPEIAQRCVELVRSFGLRYAAMDLAVTPDDEFVFVTMDPEGAFLDTNAVLPVAGIVHAIADTLTKAVAQPRPAGPAAGDAVAAVDAAAADEPETAASSADLVGAPDAR
jgi:glutathione synthase/RimK-type ligase-like ATP-grasp enzyme